jgi:hypothetical protein
MDVWKKKPTGMDFAFTVSVQKKAVVAAFKI